MEETEYICPGEGHPISRPVHLSRLASAFPNCRDCPHRFDTGHLPAPSLVRLEGGERRIERKSLFAEEGVRGVYLNELSRREAHLIAAALARVLWEQKPLRGRAQSAARTTSRTQPVVLVGHDDRPASPDLMTGVVAALRRMGCSVVDIGLSSKPCFWFAADHLQVHAGIHVNGAGCPPAGMALDFVGTDGRPLSRQSRLMADRQNLSLNRIEAQVQDPYPRATRQAGPYRTFRATVPYEAGLWKHFQALRPLRTCLASGSMAVGKTLARIYENLPGELLEVPLPKRKRNPLDPDDPDVIRITSAVKEQEANVGVLIDDDGQRCAFFDEMGQLLSVAQTTRLISEVRHGDCPNDPVILEDFSPEELESLLKRLGMRVARGGVTMAQMSDSMRGHHGSFGGGASGRYWFREAFPTSDAIIALAAILKSISRAETSLSQLV
jgi:phosphomannomutase